ncbi:retrovirus-related pol polyprotein from transposon TNT 1-94 [Tanacetum coccineum]
MTGDREKFKNVDETPKSQVRLGDDKQVQVEGNGTVVVTLQGRERMCWFYFLTYKSEAFGFFKKFKALAENQSNRKLMVLRTNRGGESLSKEFNGFSNEHGIKRELTAPYTPEQNGIAERKNKTIVEMARLEGKSCDFAMFAGDPTNAESAIGKEVWKKAMQKEINSIEKNGTWKLLNLPEGKKAIGLKLIFKTKLHSDGTIQRHKARLVARGYVQEQGIDFEETFSAVARF